MNAKKIAAVAVVISIIISVLIAYGLLPAGEVDEGKVGTGLDAVATIVSEPEDGSAE